MNSKTPFNLNSLESIINEGKSKINTDIRDDIVSSIYATSRSLCSEAVSYQKERSNRSDTLDSIFTSRLLGFPIMLLMLGAVFYVTIAGANVPSSLEIEDLGRVKASVYRSRMDLVNGIKYDVVFVIALSVRNNTIEYL